jgi:hypothetical protein
MRQYFDSENNANSPWYCDDVNEKNVLLYISESKNHFPLTPVKIVDMWECIEDFKRSLKQSEKMLGTNLGLSEEAVSKISKPTSTVKYQTGEVTLEKIGESLGGLTPTMINKLSTSAMDKIRTMSEGLRFDTFVEDALERLNHRIIACRVEAAHEYAKSLKESNGRIKDFISGLVKKRIMTKNDMKLITDAETVALTLLFTKPVNEIVGTLLHDISLANNVFKSYQSSVARKAFPEKKRGRPKKCQEEVVQQHV